MSSLEADPLDRLVSVLEADTLPAIFNGEVGPEKGGCYVYGRAFNPTVRHLGRQLAALEGCEAAYPCSSGMAAISCTLMALCNTGDHIVASNTIYGGSHALLKTFLPTKAAIHTTFVDITDLAAVRAALEQHPGRTKVVYTEVVSNPTLRVADLRALAELTHGSGAHLVVDNTFTPFVVTPARFGADVVVHSLTKFVSGASDIIGGAVCGSAAFIRSLMDFHSGPCMLLGPTMDPRVASELSLRLPHLALRMQEHGRRAAAFASRLEALGAAVTYPGLASHPQQSLMRAQANEGYGLGGLLGLDLGTPARANAFMERLQNRHGFGFMAVSLGYFDSLMSLSAASTSSELSDGDLAASGIGRGYVRMSIGITGSLEERWRQLEEAYSFATQLGPSGAVPYRAVKMRRSPSGAVQQLLSWPSMGSFGHGALELAATAAAAAAAKGGDGAAAAAVDGETEPGADGGDDSDITSAPSVLPAAEAAAAAAAPPPPKAAAPSPFVAGPAPPPRGGGGSAGAAELSQPPPALADGGVVVAGAATPPLARASAGGGGGGAVAVADAAAGARPGPDSGLGSGFGRPVKIRRTGSGEIHYVAVMKTGAARDE
ncbi:hypothetical protein PLESTM_001774700 [Pleodorina starrii]|nr:hypothetical protein PLESTM_001774700 [Pleodorina starrii]